MHDIKYERCPLLLIECIFFHCSVHNIIFFMPLRNEARFKDKNHILSFCVFQNLTRFSLRENKIKELPKGIGKLEKLVIFDISHNHLEHLPDGKSN